jgi:hypothetical protein
MLPLAYNGGRQAASAEAVALGEASIAIAEIARVVARDRANISNYLESGCEHPTVWQARHVESQ